MGKPRRKHYLQINEVFESIQGEGQLQGERTIFIRTTGCNLRCPWCDTKYSYSEGERMSVDEIMDKVKSFSAVYVCITGGEPLLQKELPALLKALAEAGYFVCVETNGTKDITKFIDVDRFIVDYKLPSAEPRKKFFEGNFDRLGTLDELKFVVADRHDYEVAREVILNYQIREPRAKILLSPCWEGGMRRKLAEWLLEDKLKAKYSLQIHKVIWNKNKRGV